jgi:hypothetical protein
MPNHHAKGREQMRKLGRKGGLASGEKRRMKKFEAWLVVVASELGVDMSALLLHSALRRAGFFRGPKRSGGSHEYDWRCPSCHHFNSEKRRACAKCKALAPMNGRLTRKALRERAEEHRIAAILRKHGL